MASENNIIVVSNIWDKADVVFDGLDISETTRADYKARIALFLEFISHKNLNRSSFLFFKQYLKERNDLAVASKNKYLASARIFLKELTRQGILPVDITLNVKSFHQIRKHKREGLNEGEVALLMHQMQGLDNTPTNTRLKAILSLLIFQGLRTIEIVRLNVEDVDLVNSTAFIQGKGQDDRELINLHPKTVRSLSHYLKSNKIAGGALFVSRSNYCRNKRITTRGLRKVIKLLFKELQIDKAVHGTRHFFVTQLIKRYKGDLLEIARYTRHRSVETLQIYNDNVRHKADLPKYYSVFEEIDFDSDLA